MKTIIHITFLLSILSLTSGCIWDLAPFCKHGRGNIITEQFSLAHFSEVRVGIDASIFLAQGSAFEVTVKAQENIIDELNLRVRNNALIIDSDRCIWEHEEIEIFISMPEIRSLVLSGSGRILGENKFTVNSLDLNISGSGKIDLAIETDKVSGNISGSGNIILEGSAPDAEYRISGSGDVHAFELETETADITISGSGNVELWVSSYLDVMISGSGNVYYRGNPNMDLRVSGSGRLVDSN